MNNFFIEMPKGQRATMFRRLARYVHPDKNTHKYANEAFLLLFSSWRHPLPSSSYCCFMIFTQVITVIAAMMMTSVYIYHQFILTRNAKSTF